MLRRLRPLVLVMCVTAAASSGVVAVRSSARLDPTVDATLPGPRSPAPASPTGGADDTRPLDQALGATAQAPPTTAAPTRSVSEPVGAPFAFVEDVVLVHPADRVERVAFHQSNHEGARPMVAAPSAVRPTVLESRERLSAPTSAADLVVDPAATIRAPVTGTVKRAGTYNLYCKLMDDYVVIAPDARPGWEVKVLHVQQESVSPGQRVEAGVTPIAAHATPLPFESQVDRVRTADPAWPHVHIEVIDPSIPNVPNGGSGSSC